MSEKIKVKTIDKIDIYFEPINEHISLSELLPDETEESLKQIENNNVIFCAKVTACKGGIELAEDYLGGCIYENYEDFYIKYKDYYFADMVSAVLSDGKKEINNIINLLRK